jgi:hypothetical protein
LAGWVVLDAAVEDVVFLAFFFDLEVDDVPVTERSLGLVLVAEVLAGAVEAFSGAPVTDFGSGAAWTAALLAVAGAAGAVPCAKATDTNAVVRSAARTLFIC